MTLLLDYPADYAQYLDRVQLERIALETLKQQGITLQADLTIVITNDAHLQQLNRDFLGVDRPTDVLSFPAGHIDPDTNRSYLGDVIISYPTALKQADRAGHPLSSEIGLLIIHGILHLLGHDHIELEERQNMWAAQDEILKSLGLDLKSPAYSPESEG